jgi:undecaprenyl-diphosphatase
MPLWLAVLLGLVQGLTEFIPVSSTAHLRIVTALTGQHDAGGAAFTAVIQLGTLAAVLIYFAKDLISLLTAMIREPGSHEGRLPWMIVLGTIPIVILGFAFKKHIETDLRSLYVITASLIVIGIVMALVDQHAVGREGRTIASLSFQDAIIIGLAQSMALIPGVSRSGATICMALLLGFARSDAARFSFLLSIPAVAGAGIFELRSALHELSGNLPAKVVEATAGVAPPPPPSIAAMAVGTAVAFVVGYASIAWFMRWLGSHQLLGFAIYRVLAGLGLLAALLAGLVVP